MALQGLEQVVEGARDDPVEAVERQVDAVVGHPVLRKIIGPDALAAVAGADQIAAGLPLLGRLGLTPLVEIATDEELVIALGVKSGLIAVNSRDLGTLEVDPERARAVLRTAQRYDVTLVAASGVHGRADVVAASEAGARAVLVGEVLMRAESPEDVLEELTGVAKAPVSQ